MAIYYLDVDDEVTSAAARIRDSSDTRIVLVLTGGARVATSRINFRLLAGEAKKRHKRLAIVTGDGTVQSVARSAGLPVFGTVGEYERAESPNEPGHAARAEEDVSEALGELAATVVSRPGSGTGRPGAGRGGNGTGNQKMGGPRVPWRATAALAFVAALALGGGLYFLYPSATVTLTVHEQVIGPVTFDATVDPNATAVDEQAGVIPGQEREFAVSASDTFDATGQRIDETAATGTVTFSSKNTANAVRVAAGTIVSTAGGVNFETTSAVTIPVANFDTGTPGKVNAPIQAVNKGLSGNVAAGTITRLPSSLAQSGLVSVTNPSATTGGTHTVTPIIAQADVDAAQAALLDRLKADFASEVGAPDAAPAGTTLFEMTASLGAATFTPDPTGLVGQEGATFDLAADAIGTALVADMSAVESLVQARVAAAVGTDFSLVNGTTESSTGDPVMRGQTVVIPVTARAREARVLDQQALLDAIRGKSLEEAKAFLAQYGLVEISMSPSWATTMPAFDFRIDFRLVEETSSPSPGATPTSGPAATPRRTAATEATPGPSAEASPSASAAASATVEPTLTPEPPTASPSEPTPTQAPSATG